MKTQMQLPLEEAMKASSNTPLTSKRGDTFLFLIVLVVALCLTPLLILGGSVIGYSYIVGGIGVLFFIALVVRRPIFGMYMVAAAALLVEQDPLVLKGASITIYAFYWPNGLTGLFERPIGFLILFIFLLIMTYSYARHRKLIEGGPLIKPFLAFLACVVMGVIWGLAKGGVTKIIVLEVRPFWYLFVSYILAYNLIKSKKHITRFFWLVIISAGIKSLQGVYIYIFLIHGDLANHHEILAHEESFFFVALILLIVLFSIHHRNKAQLYTALATMPFLIIALIANQRRADYVALLVGIAVAWLLVFLVRPDIRKRLLVLGMICLVFGSAYVAAFYHSGGSIAAPARAIVAVFHPDPNDVANYTSNLYRVIENADLKYTVKQSPIIGYGFGRQFLQPTPLPVLATSDPTFNGNPYLYIPHNTIYWVWMRLGALGFMAFWYLIGSIIIGGCVIVRQLKDRYLQLIAIYIVSITVMEIILAFADYQLYFYRNVIYLGLLAGMLMKLTWVDKKEEQVDNEAAHTVRMSARPGLGSKRPQLSSSKSAGATARRLAPDSR